MTTQNINDFGHWQSDIEITNDLFGFVYCITNTVTGRRYIGSKQLYFRRGRIRKDSDWRTYTSSSTWLNDDITRLGKDKFTFRILATANSKKMLNYIETKLIIEHGALWSNTYYNQFLFCKIKVLKFPEL